MLVKVRAFAGFREILGKELELDVEEGSTVRDFLDKLAIDNRRFKDEAFDESGQLRDYVLLMKNRKRIDSKEDLSTKLKEGDELAIFPPVAGG
jgi:sulfur-carrier protein